MKSKYIEKLHDMMKVQNPLIEYYNDMNQEVILKILNDMEEMMDGFGEALKITRKAFNVITECLQNIARYADIIEDKETLPIFVFDRQTDKYLIASGNLVHKGKLSRLRKRLEDLNELDWYGIQQAYKVAIKSNALVDKEDKNSAGLGFIEMARKSEQKLQFDFIEHDDSYAYFLLIITILKK